MKYISKKELIVFSAILVILAVSFAGYKLYQDSRIPENVVDCEALTPVLAEADCDGYSLDKVISFSEKQRISYGKYGFRKRLVIIEPTVVMQYVTDSHDQKHMYYGIYRDENLTEIVNEVDQGYNLKAGYAFEEGAKLEDYPKYQKMIVQPLEPGTYYIGVYTKNPKENFDFLYRSQFAVKKEEYDLEENQVLHFFICEKEQAVYFKVVAEAPHEVEVVSDSYEEDLQLCDKDKNVIQALARKRKGKINGYRGSIYSAKLSEKGTYYIKIVKRLDTDPATDVLNVSYILYRSI